VLHYAGYSLLGIPPYHWYYGPLVLATVVLGSLGAACAFEHGTAGQKLVASVAVAVPIVGLAVVGLENGFPPREAPIHSNWATPRTIPLDRAMATRPRRPAVDDLDQR
jgi:hypothetical protein